MSEHSGGPWAAFYKHKYNEWHVSIPAENGGMSFDLFPDGVPTEHPEGDAKLIASGPDMEATIATQRALIAELVGALLTLAEPTGLGETPCWCGASWHMPAHAPDCTQASAAMQAAKEAE